MDPNSNSHCPILDCNYYRHSEIFEAGDMATKVRALIQFPRNKTVHVRIYCPITTRKCAKLGVSVQYQRSDNRRYVAGNATIRTAERMEMLQRLNFEWSRLHDLTLKES